MPDFKDYLPEAPQEIIDALNREHSAVDPDLSSGGVPSESASTTKSELHLYADGTNGDDNNSGLISSEPKKTLQAVFDLIPDIVKHIVVVHLNGTFSPAADVAINKVLQPHSGMIIALSPSILIDGGDSKTDILAAMSSTAGTTTSLTKAGAGWGVDAYAGYFVEVLDGPEAGFIKVIRSNTTDTLHFAGAMSGAPGTPNFRVFRYTTTINGPNDLFIEATGSDSSRSRIAIQRLHWTNSWILSEALCSVILDGVTLTAGSDLVVYGGAGIFTGLMYYDPVTFAIDYPGAGFSSFSSDVRVSKATFIALQTVVISSPEVTLHSNEVVIGAGSRLKDSPCRFIQTKQFSDGLPVLDPYYALAPSIDNSLGVGIILESCRGIKIGDADISNCGSHGIELNDSKVHFSDATTGSGNTGAGVYAHSGSIVHIKDGSPPTLTGTVGDVSTDGTTQATTWSAVDGGTPFVDVQEGATLIKEV